MTSHRRLPGVSRCRTLKSKAIRGKKFNEKQLAKAIETRDRCYKLLMWISHAIGEGLIQPKSTTHNSGGPAAAIDWLRYNYELIPEEVRPPEDDIPQFGAFFSTFLTSSFDVVEKPGTRGDGFAQSPVCTCCVCMRIVNAPHLQTKKLYARDKRRANFLMCECLLGLAKRHCLNLDEERAKQIVNNSRTRRLAAYQAYGHWLIQRLSGESDGPAVLALWRIIAWDPRGGMRREFTLELNDFRNAEQDLLNAMKEDG